MQHGVGAGATGGLVQSWILFSLVGGPDRKADPDAADDPEGWKASASVSDRKSVV